MILLINFILTKYQPENISSLIKKALFVNTIFANKFVSGNIYFPSVYSQMS